MAAAIAFDGEHQSNAAREVIGTREPLGMRTFTPSQAVLATSAGVFHTTPEGRRLYDYTSGVLVSNLGHNPVRWTQRWMSYLGWSPSLLAAPETHHGATGLLPADTYFPAVTMTAYNAISPIEATAVERLVASLRRTSNGQRLDTIVWAASGSEAIHKALSLALARDPQRDVILATRHGFHGKKGLSNAVTGSETDPDRDPRVKFISFPMEEIRDLSLVSEELPLDRYRAELDALLREHGPRLTALITEPYLGGGGSFHPPLAYHRLLERFCREHDLLLIFDEVQANFGRTGSMYAFEKYDIEPDMVVLGKGLGNGVPVAAVALGHTVTQSMGYGSLSDTWSANPLSCAAVVATLDEFEQTNVLANAAARSKQLIEGLKRLKQTGVVAHVRGEGMVFGLECAPLGHLPASEVARALVRECYLGEDNYGIHLLGPLAGKVLRVSPPLTMTEREAEHSLRLLERCAQRLSQRLTA